MKLTGFRLVGVDFLLMTLAFFMVNQTKRGGLALPEGYGVLLWLFYGAWVLSGLVGKKFAPAEYAGFREGAMTLVKSALYLAFTIAFVVVMFGMVQYSRVQSFATCGVLLGLEMLVWGTAVRFGKVQQGQRTEGGPSDDYVPVVRDRFSVKFALVDLGLFFAAFFVVNYMKRGHFDLFPGYEQLMMMQLVLGAMAAIAAKKYYVIRHRNFYFALWQWLKAGFLLMACTGVMVYGLRLFHYSRFQGFGTVVMLMVLETVTLGVYFSTRKSWETESDIESADQMRKALAQEHYDLNVDIETVRKRLMRPAIYKLQRTLQPDEQAFLAFLKQHVDLNDILYVETQVERSSTFIALHDDYLMLRLFVGLRKLNDCRRLNVHFLQLHQMLLPGGYFVGYAHTVKTHYDWIYARFPRPMAHAVYALDFFFHRVAPKLTWIQKVYFAVTQGKNRVISRAELLGRLCFCGFEIVATKVIDNRFYFIVRKFKTISVDTNPTFGPLVALKRTGFEGKPISVYKFRTMHPFSEYLQEYVFNNNGTKDGDKILNDFRVTGWGKILRKIWIDELPMLYNWLNGDLKLVGVRPLSAHKLSTYPKALQEKRKKVKPGLLPPFYADRPDSVEGFFQAEDKYLDAYLQSPFMTDFRYFWIIVWNIVIKRARSK